jgi:hypothetical protein
MAMYKEFITNQKYLNFVVDRTCDRTTLLELAIYINMTERGTS